MRKYASTTWDLIQRMKEMMTTMMMNARVKKRLMAKSAKMLSIDLVCVVQENVKVRISMYGLGDDSDAKAGVMWN